MSAATLIHLGLFSHLNEIIYYNNKGNGLCNVNRLVAAALKESNLFTFAFFSPLLRLQNILGQKGLLLCFFPPQLQSVTSKGDQ